MSFYSRARFQPLLAAFALALSGLIFFSGPAQAVPPAPNDIPLPQPDGSTIQARQWGDRWQNGYETTDGYTIISDPDSGFWVYAAEVEGQLVPAQVDQSALIAGQDQPEGLQPGLRPARVERVEIAPRAQMNAAEFTPNVGTQPLLVLLVGFSDRPGSTPPETFQRSFFGASNSVQAYYRQASFGQLNLSPAAESQLSPNDGVIGWINLNYPHPNNSDLSPKIVNDALTAANPYINYASFDKNGDGYISNRELHLVVVTAGYEEAVSGSYGPSPRMWAHRWALDSGGYTPSLDSVRLGQASHDGGYTIFGELHDFGPGYTHPATIGVMVHELGHDLSWPDLYDTSQFSEGVGNWSIMGSGSWNIANTSQRMYGDAPAMPDAFLKYYQGWITPILARSGQTFTLSPAHTNPSALLVGSNPNGVDWNFRTRRGTGEYWLVEYRQQQGFDSGLPGCGILIWHIDESVTSTNEANAYRDRPLIELEQADGRRDLYNSSNQGDSGDPYPGSSRNLAFDQSSTPNSNYYSSSPSGQGLSIRSESCGSSMQVKMAGLLVTEFSFYLPSLFR